MRGSHTRVPILRKSAPFPRVKPPANPESSRGRAFVEPTPNFRRGARAGLRFPLVRGPLCRRGWQNVFEIMNRIDFGVRSLDGPESAVEPPRDAFAKHYDFHCLGDVNFCGFQNGSKTIRK